MEIKKGDKVRFKSADDIYKYRNKTPGIRWDYMELAGKYCTVTGIQTCWGYVQVDISGSWYWRKDVFVKAQRSE